MLTPRQKTPALSVETLSHGAFDIAAMKAERGALICFYRGLHCPICIKYLAELEAHIDSFAAKGFETIAISADDKERAQGMAEKAGLSTLRLGYGLPLGVARDWGLYISTSRGKTSIGLEEPALFSEPGLFVVNADQSAYYVSVQSMPFGRPHFSELSGALDFVIEKNYPARGEHVGAV